ncbi:MAG: serine protease [Acetobacteraceae bacterium]|nr:serine protease [Acetobacteraceae bacterium]
MDIIEQLSLALADRLTAAAPSVVSLMMGSRHCSGILWRPDAVVTSEEAVGENDSARVRQGEAEVAAKLAGRDPGTNIAVFRLATPLTGSLPPTGATPRPGSLALVVGADASGAPTGRLAMVHATGPAWHSMAGGLIDTLIRLDVRLGADEGGPVLDQSGAFLGMSTAGPRRRAMVIPAATIVRVAGPLLTDGRIARGWLGVGLQSVAIAEKFQAEAGQARGAMVLQLVANASAEQAGVLPGDILLGIDGHRFGRGRRIVSLMGPERIGQTVTVRLLRGAEVKELPVTITARPGG